MKLLLLLLPLFSFGQTSIKKACWKGSILFTAGIIQGAHEANLHHPDIFNRVHGTQGMDWFKPVNNNKYKPGTKEPRFFGSTTFAVPLTDFYHASKASWILCSGVGFTISIYEKRTWKQFALETLAGFAVQKLGFLLTYNYFYK